MNIDQLKETWENLHQEGLASPTEDGIKKIINNGTSEIVAEINRKLFKEIFIMSIALFVSVFGIIFFYYVFDPIQHPWIDVSKIIPIQLLAFTIFFVLFVFGFLEYRLVNRKFNSQSVKAYVSSLLSSLQKYNWLFMMVVLPLLFGVFYVELDYFLIEEGARQLSLKVGGSALLTVISYAVIRRYYKMTFGPYISTLSSYKEELS